MSYKNHLSRINKNEMNDVINLSEHNRANSKRNEKCITSKMK